MNEQTPKSPVSSPIVEANEPPYWWRTYKWAIVAALLAAILVLSWIFGIQVDIKSRRFGWSTVSTTIIDGTDTSTDTTQPPLTIDDYLVPSGSGASVDDDPSLGDANAPLTMIEFTDYDCPFCKLFFTDVFSGLKAQYIDTGKVRFVVRDFPIDSLHPNARTKAEASECADEQGKFFEFHDHLFSDTVSINDLGALAEDLGMDRARFQKCVDDRTYKAEVEKDIADGEAAGITGTPGFVVGDKVLAGAPAPNLLFPFLDDLVSQASGE